MAETTEKQEEAVTNQEVQEVEVIESSTEKNDKPPINENDDVKTENQSVQEQQDKTENNEITRQHENDETIDKLPENQKEKKEKNKKDNKNDKNETNENQEAKDNEAKDNEAKENEDSNDDTEDENKTEDKDKITEKKKTENELREEEEYKKLSALLNEARLESNDLRSHNFHLLSKVIELIDKNDNSLGLETEIPSTMNLLSTTNNMESKQNELYENILKEVEYLHIEYSTKQKYYNEKIINLNNSVIENDENAINLKNTYKNFKRKICKNVNKKSTNSTKIETKWILQKEEEEEEIDGEIEQERLKNIHYNINLKKLTQK